MKDPVLYDKAVKIVTKMKSYRCTKNNCDAYNPCRDSCCDECDVTVVHVCERNMGSYVVLDDDTILGAKKFDQGKLPYDIVPWDAVEKIIEIMQYGAKKYGKNNWQNLPDFNDRYFAALERHIIAWRKGEKLDSESGLSHLAHAGCNALFLIWKSLQEEKDETV